MYALNMVDVIILQGLGDTAVASVSIVNQANYVINMLIFGTASGSSILVSQFRGSRDFDSMRKTIVVSLILVGSITAAAAFFMTLFPVAIMRIMTNQESLIYTGARFLRIVAFSYMLSGLTQIMSVLLRCNEKTKLPLAAGVIALSINSFLNYILVYGKLGMPALGVEGSAIATLIARIIEFMIILYFVYFCDENEIKPYLKDLFNISKSFIKTYAKIASPVILNEFAWGFGMSTYGTIYGRMGESTVAAMSVASIMEQTFAVVAIGAGHVTTIILGKELGNENFETAKNYAKTLSFWAVALGLVTTFIMAGFAPFFVKHVFTNLTPATMSLAMQLIIMFSFYMPIRAFNYTNIVGTLRSGGDSIFAAFLDVSPMYIMSIPLGIFLGLYLKWPSIYVIPIMYGEEFVKAVLGFRRMLKYKWVRRLGQVN